MPLTAVTFDLWQTLLLDNRELGRARALVRLEGAQNALRKFGQEHDLEHIREAYRACYRQCHQIRDCNVDVSFREQVEMFVNNIRPELAGQLPPELFDEILTAYADSFFIHPPTTHPAARKTLERVKGMGLRVGLISNTGMTPGVTFRQFLDQEGLLAYFDALTFSDEVKLAKPSDEIFLLTLRELEATPSETVHVGDHVKNDVVGAKRVGLKTVWITGFYEREDPDDPLSEPDAIAPDLGLVPEAIAGLAD